MIRSRKIILAIFLFVSLLLGRVFFESRSEWNQGQQAVQSGRSEEAVHHLARSIHWYFPGNPFTAKGVKLLWEIGQGAEAQNPRLALLAYDSLRGSLHAIRSFYWPYKEWILQANGRIAELRALEQVQNEPGLAKGKALSFHKKVLVLDERPFVGWVLVVEIGFFGWILSVLGWIWKGFDSRGRMNFRPSLPWMIALVGFFSMWLVGLVRA